MKISCEIIPKANSQKGIKLRLKSCEKSNSPLRNEINKTINGKLINPILIPFYNLFH